MTGKDKSSDLLVHPVSYYGSDNPPSYPDLRLSQPRIYWSISPSIVCGDIFQWLRIQILQEPDHGWTSRSELLWFNSGYRSAPIPTVANCWNLSLPRNSGIPDSARTRSRSAVDRSVATINHISAILRETAVLLQLHGMGIVTCSGCSGSLAFLVKELSMSTVDVGCRKVGENRGRYRSVSICFCKILWFSRMWGNRLIQLKEVNFFCI